MKHYKTSEDPCLEYKQRKASLDWLYSTCSRLLKEKENTVQGLNCFPKIGKLSKMVATTTEENVQKMTYNSQ